MRPERTSRPTTSTIHRADVGEASTRCGLALSRPLGFALPIPALRRRPGVKKVKLVTVDHLVTCRRCGSNIAGAAARVDALADIAAAERRSPVLDLNRTTAPGSAVETAIADDARRRSC